ncbi:SusC/RagA family TonB-linked outer membrane protein [Xanthovirga aplysinae]|uniref:SusC/RagA family TonB-linked outer membrane protein n=1 Tax=Xanthovirga aplysinae TaxID=2529853 RepID=UPI0012BCF096|nr:SusC/RagA family TonB-linked outer membrane protein [Xanthovirga aplysinae]MTI32032.1 SusC/RagA family TonB-linked outer membrane protein [Xanthovirga aplysinae]
MKKIVLICLLLVCSLAWQSYAQERVITGTVMAEQDSSPLPGVNVILKDRNDIGTITDVDGKFSLEIPEEGGTLVFSFIGLAKKEVEIGARSVLDIMMSEDVQQLSEVVVTALGIERQKKALGYSVQEVNADEISESKETNIVNALAGKVAGVQVTNSSGAVGASSRIVIRGNSSFTGENQPLFIVDGIPIDNSSFSSDDEVMTTSDGTRESESENTVDYGNAAMDLNPEDIASFNVLKGPTAVALYGSRAQNGAIVITTKSGKGVHGKNGGIGISYNTSYAFTNPLRLPSFQNLYGQGEESDRGDNQSTGYLGWDQSFGAPFDGREMVDMWGNRVRWEANPDNVKDFLETGHIMSHNLALAGSSDKSHFRFSVSDFRQKGILPNTAYGRNTFGFKGGSKLSESLNVTASINYTRGRGENRPGGGYESSNVFQSLFNWFGRQTDITSYKNYRDENGNLLIDPVTNKMFAPVRDWQSNPYFTLNENVNKDEKDRIIGNVNLEYQLTDWLSTSFRAGTDFYNDFRKQVYAVGTVYPTRFANGGFYEDKYFVKTYNIDYVISAQKDFGNEFSANAMVGLNRYHKEVRNSYAFAEGLIAENIYNLGNVAGNPIVNNYTLAKRINGLYFTGQVGYKNVVFMDISGRNDWSSTLPKGNRSYFYPAINTSVVFSDIIDLPFLSFGKIRGGIAQVGNDTDPYRLINYFTKPIIDEGSVNINFPLNGQPSFTTGDLLANADLKPERTTSWEIGTDLRFLDGKLSVDFTYYSALTKDQLVPVRLSSASGFKEKMLNAGEIRNSGVELMINATPLDLPNGFKWNTSLNFSKNKNTVVSIHPDVTSIILGQERVNIEVREGEPYGVIVGTKFLRDDQDRLVINSDGLPIVTSGTEILGNVSPDFMAGLWNEVEYKNLRLSFLIDMKQGGDIFSVTDYFGKYAGVLDNSLLGREGGNETGLVVPGVLADENGDPTNTQNNIVVSSQNYYQNYGGFETSVYDGSFIKLREVKVGYSLPASLIKNTPFGKIDISLYGRNLWLIHSNVPHIDPETSAFGSGNAQGIETNSHPSLRSFGASLNVTL